MRREENMRYAVLLWALVQALEELKDGETIFLDSSVDPDVTFIFRSGQTSNADLTITVTLYSATESLTVCISHEKPGRDCEYEGSALRPVVVIPAKKGIVTGGVLEVQSGLDVTKVLSPHQTQVYSFKLLNKKSLLSIFLSQYSGDTDLVLSTESTCTPAIVTSTRQGNDLITLSSPERELLFNRTTGWVYICAITELESAYSLRVDEEGNRAKVLMFDTMEKAMARRNSFVYYQLLVEGNATVTVRVIVQTGNPDLYICLCKGNYCTFNENQVHRPEDCKCYLDGILHSSNTDGDEEIVFSHTESLCEKDCHYTIGVLGRKEVSVFWVIATLEQGHIHLAASMPFVTKAPRATTTYFKHTVTSWRVRKVEFLLIPIVGDPDLYVSTLTPYPSNTSEYSSTNLGSSEELITIEKPQGESLVGEYYIAVISSQPASFSLSAIHTLPEVLDKLELTPGLETVYPMEDMQTIILILDLSPNPANPSTLRLSTIPNTGKVTVCLPSNRTDSSNCLFTYQCTSVQPFDCIQEVPLITANLPLSAQYYALVTLETAERSSLVTMTYSSGQHVHLSSKAHHRDIIQANRYYYYCYTLFPPYAGVKVQESIVSGDIDLYLSFSEKYPTNETAQYKAETGFEDRITVSRTDMASHCPPELCVAYISARASVRSAFSLHFAAPKDSIYNLFDGGKTYHTVVRGERYILELTLTSQSPATIVITSYEGTPSVRGQLVPATSFTYTEAGLPVNATQFSSGFKVSVSPALIAEWCVSTQCALWAIVECREPFCWFQATATQSTYQLIAPNEPLCDSVRKDSINYYLLYTAHNFTDLTVDLTLLSSRLDADLYMNRGTDVTDISLFHWKSTQIGSDSIHISAEDYIANLSLNWGYFVIAVKGKDEAQYCLRVTVEATSMIPLGFMSLHLRIKPQNSVFCYFYHQYRQDFLVDGTVKYGSAQLYLKSYPGNLNTTASPSDIDHHWQSSTLGGSRQIGVSHSDPHFCYHCLYVLRVENSGHSGAEILLSRAPAQSSHLIYPYFPLLLTGLYDSMLPVDVGSLEDVSEFFILPIKGKVSLLASRHRTPSPTYYDYKGQDIGGIQYFAAVSSYQLYLGAFLHSNSVFLMGMGRPQDMRYIEEVDEMVLGTLYKQGTERGFYVRGNCTCQIAADGFNFTVVDYVVHDDYRTLVREYTAQNPIFNRVTIDIGENTHLILIISGENGQIDPQQQAILRLSVCRYPFAQGLGFNSELIGQFSTHNQLKEYRLNVENLSVELEIGVETCGMEVELAVTSVLQDGNKREEVALYYLNNTLKSAFSLQNVSYVSVKIAPKETFYAENNAEFRLYSRVINEDIELFPGASGYIQVLEGGNIRWEPLAATARLDLSQITYQLYCSAQESSLQSLCRLHSGLLHGNVTFLGSQNYTTAVVPTDLWVTVVAVERGQWSTTLRSYTPYTPVHVPTSGSSDFPTSIVVSLSAVLLALLVLFLYCCKRRSSPSPSLQSSELTSLAA